MRYVIIIMLVILLGTVAYIFFDKYNNAQAVRDMGSFQQGVQIGYQQAIIQLVQQASTCQPVPIFIENQTINMIAVDCLNEEQ